MMGRAHLIIGTGISLSVLALTGHEITFAAAAVAAVGSLLPDIDEPNSLLLTRTLSGRMLRVLQVLMVAAAGWVLFAEAVSAPWNLVLAILIVAASFMPSRTMRKVIIFVIGAAIAWYGTSYAPWNYLAGCLLMICTVVPHRGLTHTVYGIAAWTALLFGTTQQYGASIWLAGGIAYTLHLLLDSLTNNGIRPLPPLPWKLRFKLMSTGTKKGARVEKLGIVLTLMLAIYAVLQSFI
ncbi:metal-dependent hydrolase [Paenibacillus sp. P96]|uniref:Metal-dependent hydrolase n=1 Tax=Paenibacillus zeirhizosphaerae TaxID=2987519 RepID=A0ABT9FTP5_9BACL|nr:metal-dependent hydrolase [Paenibacillus sp. P96]MDP4098119.1 metal-dependent hydrolase [Paenibacillus sp. P96]